MFSERLKELRKEKGISQYDLANDLGIVQSNIGNWESGRREPNYETVIRLARYFDVTVDYLIGASDERKHISQWEHNGRKYTSYSTDNKNDPAPDVRRAVEDMQENDLGVKFTLDDIQRVKGIPDWIKNIVREEIDKGGKD